MCKAMKRKEVEKASLMEYHSLLIASLSIGREGISDGAGGYVEAVAEEVQYGRVLYTVLTLCTDPMY
jgi:hypothetical protein